MKIIKQAIRTLSKFRLYFTINLLGLILSLTCGMILLRYIHQELTVDHYVKDLDRTYLTVREFQNRSPILNSITNRNNDPNFVNIIDVSVESYSTFTILRNTDVIVDNSYYKVNTIATDTMFLDILTYQLKTGSLKFRSPNDAIITDKLAKKIFGNENPLGRTIVYEPTGNTHTVTGVLKEPVTKASINFDLLISTIHKNQWNVSGITLIKLFSGVDVKKQNSKYAEFIPLSEWANVQSRLQLFPLKGSYINNTFNIDGNFIGVIHQGNSNAVMILSTVLILILVVGFFNYSNIYTVLTLNRAREFGVKKVYGATGKYVFGQIWLENLLLTLIALFVVWTVIELTGGLMESLFSIPIKTNLLFDVYISFFILLVFPILVSIYPAIKYNYSPPIVSLRSINITGKSVVSRVIFLSLQYVVTFFILVVSLFFMKQLHYMLNMDLGYRTNDIIRFDVVLNNRAEEGIINRVQWERNIKNIMQQKMDESPLIERFAYGDFMHSITPRTPMKKEGGEFQLVANASLSSDYMDIFEFQLIEGRLWGDSKGNSSDKPQIIINETAKRIFDIKDISQEFLQRETLVLPPGININNQDINSAYEIVGVIKDFKTNHLSKENVPLIISNNRYSSGPFIAVINPKKREETIKFLKDTYIELVGERDFEYTFLEDEIDAMYKEDKQVTTIFITFALVAILISCLGLYGLSLFDIRQRYREIALRKINGASVKDIISLLLKKYTYILAVSFLLAVPVSYYLTLYFQIKRAVRINPAVVLKSE